jgi:general secretion pathway protein D
VNLLMILVPHIIETPDDIRRIEQQRRRERQELLERETSFRHRDLDANVDWRHKSGLLSAINREAARMQEVQAAVRRAEAELQRPVVSGELGLAPEPLVRPSEPSRPLPAPAGGATRRPPG